MPVHLLLEPAHQEQYLIGADESEDEGESQAQVADQVVGVDEALGGGQQVHDHRDTHHQQHQHYDAVPAQLV